MGDEEEFAKERGRGGRHADDQIATYGMADTKSEVQFKFLRGFAHTSGKAIPTVWLRWHRLFADAMAENVDRNATTTGQEFDDPIPAAAVESGRMDEQNRWTIGVPVGNADVPFGGRHYALCVRPLCGHLILRRW